MVFEVTEYNMSRISNYLDRKNPYGVTPHKIIENT